MKQSYRARNLYTRTSLGLLELIGVTDLTR